ncbi:MAG: PhoD-like phosphatase N-terminal domain-containing protein [Ilumatobacteraceae bacterium]
MSAAQTFEFGLASGDVGEDRVTLWTHVASRSAQQAVSWWIAPASGRSDSPGDPDGEPEAVVRSGATRPDPVDDGTIHVEVFGLRPGTAYRFGFQVDGGAISGRTKTLPAQADRVRFVVASCSRLGWPGFEQYGAIVAEEPDFVLHLEGLPLETGGPTPTGVTLEPPDECRRLDDYRSRYRQRRRDPGSSGSTARSRSWPTGTITRSRTVPRATRRWPAVSRGSGLGTSGCRCNDRWTSLRSTGRSTSMGCSTSP